jgi:O-antigen/teichoic acid export membrane protein
MRPFLSNIASLMAGNLFQLFVNFIFSLVLIQKLSASEYGFQSAILAFSNTVMALAYMNLFNITSRELTGKTPDEQSRIYSSIFSLQLTLSVVVCAGAAVVAWLLGSFPSQQFPVFLLGLFTLVLSYAPIAPTEAFLIVRGQMWRIAVLQSLYALGACILGVSILLSGGHVAEIYVALSLLSILEISLYMREAWRLVPGGPRLNLHLREWRHYFGEGLPGGLGGFFYLSSRSIGVYLVYTFINPESAGYLGLCTIIVAAVILIVWVPYSVSILPVLRQLHLESEARLKWLSSRSITWLLAASLPIAVGGMLLAPELLGILGPEKVVAAPTFRIFVWLLPFTLLADFINTLLLVSLRQRMYLLGTALGAVVNIALCYALIPAHGAEGAAFAALVGVSTITLVCGWAARGMILPQVRYGDVLRLTLALVGMVLVVQVSAGAYVLVRVGLGAATFGAVTLALGLFSLVDWHTARTLLVIQK